MRYKIPLDKLKTNLSPYYIPEYLEIVTEGNTTVASLSYITSDENILSYTNDFEDLLRVSVSARKVLSLTTKRSLKEALISFKYRVISNYDIVLDIFDLFKRERNLSELLKDENNGEYVDFVLTSLPPKAPVFWPIKGPLYSPHSSQTEEGITPVEFYLNAYGKTEEDAVNNLQESLLQKIEESIMKSCSPDTEVSKVEWRNDKYKVYLSMREQTKGESFEVAEYSTPLKKQFFAYSIISIVVTKSPRG